MRDEPDEAPADADGEGDPPGDSWEQHAAWWIDRFTDGVDPEYVHQIIPLAVAELGGCARVVDVGCGDGQIARALAAAGVDVVAGVDPARNQVATARDRAGGASYAQAVAGALPVRTGSVDGAVASLVFEHIADLDEAVAEIARVLAPGGRFAFFLNHPLLQTPGSGWIDDHTVDPPEQYWRLGPYLVESDAEEQVERGIWIRFVHRPLSRYVNTLATHGLTVERMVEPAPPGEFLERAPGYAASAAIPRLLYLRLRRDDANGRAPSGPGPVGPRG